MDSNLKLLQTLRSDTRAQLSTFAGGSLIRLGVEIKDLIANSPLMYRIEDMFKMIGVVFGASHHCELNRAATSLSDVGYLEWFHQRKTFKEIILSRLHVRVIETLADEGTHNEYLLVATKREHNILPEATIHWRKLCELEGTEADWKGVGEHAVVVVKGSLEGISFELLHKTVKTRDLVGAQHNGLAEMIIFTQIFEALWECKIHPSPYSKHCQVRHPLILLPLNCAEYESLYCAE